MGYNSIINGIKSATVSVRQLRSSSLKTASNKPVLSSLMHFSADEVYNFCPKVSFTDIFKKIAEQIKFSNLSKQIDKLENKSVKSLKKEIVECINPKFQDMFLNLAKMKNRDGSFVYSGKDLKETLNYITPAKEKIINRLIPLTAGNGSLFTPDNMKTLLKLSDKQINKIQKHQNLLDAEVFSIIEELNLHPNQSFNEVLKEHLKPATKFSRKVNIKGKDFKIVSVPKPLNGKEPKKYEIVAIVDCFSEKSIGVKGLRHYSHGELVQKILTNGLENRIGVLEYDAKSLIKSLRDLLKKKKESQYGKHIKKLNLSIGTNYYSYKKLSSLVGFQINEDNILQHKKTILKSLSKLKHYLTPGNLIMTTNEIKLINKLVDSGIDVCISAGNGGADTINLLSLSKAKIIGAVNANKIAHYSSDTPLVKDYAKGDYAILDGQTKFLSKKYREKVSKFSINEMIARLEIENQKSVQECLNKIENSVTDDENISGILAEFGFLNSPKYSKNTDAKPKIVAVNDDVYKLAAYIKHRRKLLDGELNVYANLEKAQSNNSKYAYIDRGHITYLKENNGRFYADFDGSNNNNQIDHLAGTSFATPTHIRETLLDMPHSLAISEKPTDIISQEYLSMIQKLRAAGIIGKNNRIERINKEDFAKAGVSLDKFFQVNEKLKEI